MRLLNAIAALSLVVASNAQNVIKVTVGGVRSGQLNESIYQFSQRNIKASNGDVIQFEFSGVAGNHSITQGTYSSPCQQIEGGFDSGWVAIPQNHDLNSPPPVWNLTVTNNANPIWFYCKQTLPQFHCSSGMVGAINAPLSGDNNFAGYLFNANPAVRMTPGQGIGGLVGQGASASAFPGPITGDIQYYGTPTTGVASSTSTSIASETTTSSTNAASTGYINPALVLVAAVMGIMLA